MKIVDVKVYHQPFTLTRPYTIAYKTQTTVDNVIVEIVTEGGMLGLGAGSPAPEVTHEMLVACLQALHENASWCIGREMDEFSLLIDECHQRFSHYPAACAAVDIALHDLLSQMHDKPLVDVLGRAHYQLPTSITIGIKNVKETLIEANEYFTRGFKVHKVKLGCDIEEDIGRIVKLREHFGNNITIRVDPNQGYSLQELVQFFDKTKDLNIEFIEQPLKTAQAQDLLQLSDFQRQKIALDENILTPRDALNMLSPNRLCGIFNIKLMKCGGIYAAQKIAQIAENANIDLMWGCMDESIISISAALHVAFASPATKYIDLDGSLDLADDIVTGGFSLKDGIMFTLNKPGLGVHKLNQERRHDQ